jgi:hypothetical protein
MARPSAIAASADPAHVGEQGSALLSIFCFATSFLQRRRKIDGSVAAILRPEPDFALATGKPFRLFAVQRATPLSDTAGLTHDRFRSACPRHVGLAHRRGWSAYDVDCDRS